MNWVIILVVIIAAIVVSKLIHFKHLKHKIFAIFIILILAFGYITFSSVVKNNNLDLKTASGVFQAGKVYFSWLTQAFGNVKELTGHAVKMEWVPKNVSLAG